MNTTEAIKAALASIDAHLSEVGWTENSNAAIEHLHAALSALSASTNSAEQQPVTSDDASELIGIAQYLRTVQNWEAQAGSQRLAEIAKKLLSAPQASDSSQPVSAPRSALTEFIDKFCLGDSKLIACAEAAFYAFNRALAPNSQPVSALTDEQIIDKFKSVGVTSPEKVDFGMLLISFRRLVEVTRSLLSATSQPVAWFVDGRVEQGLFFNRDSAEAMAEANCGIVKPLVFGSIQHEKGCSRSHPHEEMSEECQRKTEEARKANAERNAELSSQPSAWNEAIEAAKQAIRNRAASDEIFVQNAIDALDALRQQAPAVPQPELTVWYGPMPESNGKSNFTAILVRKGGDFTDGITIDRSEYPDRVRYEADRVRYLIGELDERPFILDYDADKHSGYVEATASHPAPSPQDAGEASATQWTEDDFQAAPAQTGETKDGVKFYCLGYTHEKCASCQNEKNWQTLNQMPDALRLPMQKSMTRIDDEKCRMTGMGEHAPIDARQAQTGEKTK